MVKLRQKKAQECGKTYHWTMISDNTLLYFQ